MPRCNHDASCNTIWRFFYFNSTCQTAYHCLNHGQFLGKVKCVAKRTLFIFPITGHVMDGSTFLETTFWSPMVLLAQSKMVFLVKPVMWHNQSDFRLKSRCQLFVHHKRKISINRQRVGPYMFRGGVTIVFIFSRTEQSPRWPVRRR